MPLQAQLSCSCIVLVGKSALWDCYPVALNFLAFEFLNLCSKVFTQLRKNNVYF